MSVAEFAVNKRIPPTNFIDIQTSKDWPILKSLNDKFSSWKENYEHGKFALHSAIEYAILLFEHGFNARAEGNYGIASMIIWRPGEQVNADGKIVLRPACDISGLPEFAIYKPELAGKFIEMVVFGHNSLFRQKKSNGHAERQSINKAFNIWLHVSDEDLPEYLEELGKRKELIFREAPDEKPSVGLVTSLEPCIGCTEVILTTGVDWVLSLNDDKLAGALHPSRLKKLTKVWSTFLPERTKIKTLFAQSKNPDDQLTYLPKELAQLVANLFFGTRQELDEQLGAGGTMMLIKGVKKEI